MIYWRVGLKWWRGDAVYSCYWQCATVDLEVEVGGGVESMIFAMAPCFLKTFTIWESILLLTSDVL